jgi:TolB-like protein/Flp pilus assembly protein TadD
MILKKPSGTGTLKVGHGKRTIASAGKPWKKAAITMTVLGVLLVVALLIGLPRWKQKISIDATAIGKSIAVLPFTNLSNDPDQEYFSDGMMEEILDRLFKIGDLKVISRTSSMRYKNTDKSIKEIAGELGVASILEGSVRRIGNNVRITVQLIDAKTDTHLWSQVYDRDLTDVFEIQSEIAQTIARELEAVIAPQEIALIEKAPTKNMEAYNYFLKGNEYFFRSYDEQDYSIAISMYSKAIELDPQFAHAYIRLSISHASMYWFHYDRSAERIIKCKEAIDAATRIDPEIPEIHLALGYYYYWCFLDYPKALEELELSETKLPNNWECIYTKSAVHRRAGEWKLAKEYVLLALTMDQSNPDITFQTAEILFLLGEYEEAERFFIKTTFLNPTLIYNYWARSLMYLKWNGNTFKARETINEAMKFKEATNNPQIVETMALIDLFDGNYQKAIAFLLSKDLEIIENQFYFRPKSLHIANIYRIMGNMDLARQNFDNARIELKTRINHDPNDSRLFSALGIVYAGLGMKEEAIESGKKGVDLMPIEKEAFRGVYRVEDLARIYVMTGEYQEAIKLLDRLLSLPGPLSVKLLLLDPTWKPLWNLTEFKKITNKYIRND